MDKYTLWILEGTAIGIAVILAVIFISRGSNIDSSQIISPANEQSAEENISESNGYLSEIPDDFSITPANSEISASDNPDVQSKVKTFDLQATKNGFIPNSITVESGDELQINFSAVDGDTDLDLPYLGAYFPAVLKGETRKFPIGTSLTGVFVFSCRDACPGGNKIQGELIVVPR